MAARPPLTQLVLFYCPCLGLVEVISNEDSFLPRNSLRLRRVGGIMKSCSSDASGLSHQFA